MSPFTVSKRNESHEIMISQSCRAPEQSLSDLKMPALRSRFSAFPDPAMLLEDVTALLLEVLAPAANDSSQEHSLIYFSISKSASLA